tara:strand:+ start:6543 stop:6734 length:192 start_codon:yes stop_codon:yes gene_type:complete
MKQKCKRCQKTEEVKRVKRYCTKCADIVEKAKYWSKDETKDKSVEEALEDLDAGYGIIEELIC